MKETPHIREFSKNSLSYKQYNIIQSKVAKEVVKNINFKPKKILDLGCGSGAVYENISWNLEKFVGVDLSEEMLKIHPKNEKIELICKNFDDMESFEGYDLVISSSAIQWSKDMRKLIKRVEKNADRFILAIFTDGTFENMRKFFGFNHSFLKSYFEISGMFSKDVSCEKLNYKLFFDNSLDMLRYIKRSGVSGGKKELEIKEIKRFIDSYPYDFLEFEVLLAKKV